MTILEYDGSLCGMLTAIFDAYDRKLSACTIIKTRETKGDFFADHILIPNDVAKAERVWKGLSSRVTINGLHNIYACYLSELEGVEDIIYEHVRHVFANKSNIEKDFGHASTLKVSQLARKVFREKHRMEAFVRFKRSADDIYYAVIDPDHNVLPLIATHFKDRFADQHWIINDVRRGYGLYYDRQEKTVNEVMLNTKKGVTFPMTPLEIFAKDESLYQNLWQDYFSSVNIPDRKNLKLHLQHVPTRYWKFLTEKQLR